MTDFAISALARKRAGMSGEIEAADERLSRMRERG